jgi:hypothetical protein
MGAAHREGRSSHSLGIALAVVLAACGSGETADTVQLDSAVALSGGSTTAVSEVSDTTSTIPPAESEPAESIPDLAVLIATIEAAMEGTSYAGAALEEPEVFIATAQLFCELLDRGMTADEVLGEYLDRLSEGGAAGATDEEVRLAGVLLGVSVEVVCPEQSDAM